MTVNKFNIHWQVRRLLLKSLKDPKEKVSNVLRWLSEDKNRNQYSKERVLNWLKTTSWAYKDEKKRGYFNKGIKRIKELPDTVWDDTDSDNDFSIYPSSILSKLLKDLEKRKYNLQFKGPPQDHVDFVKKLEKHLNK